LIFNLSGALVPGALVPFRLVLWCSGALVPGALVPGALVLFFELDRVFGL